MESEKLSLKQQLSKAEKDLQSARKEIEKVVIGGIRDTAIFFELLFLFSFYFDFGFLLALICSSYPFFFFSKDLYF